MPLISVVTVCYNSERTIRKTIESVQKQEGDFEYLIIDGGSTDQTIAIVKQYESGFKGKLLWISEKDNGWYDAMNKGICLSNGRFIVFLNSDDYFDDNSIKSVEDYIISNEISDNEIVYGDSTNIYCDSNGTLFYRKIVAPEYISQSNRKLLDGMCGIRHQSMFVGRGVYKKVGMLDLQYRLHADWDFLIKCIYQKIRMHHIKENLTFYSMYGASTKLNFVERHLLRKNNRMYRVVDFYYIKDRWGIKTLLKGILGDKKWNDVLIKIHRRRGL